MMTKISKEHWQIQSAVKDIYDNLVDSKKLFHNNYHLFSAGLVYGLMYNKRHTVKPNADFIKLHLIGDDVIKNTIDIVFCVLDDGRDSREIWVDMLYIADGGVLALNEIYHANNNFRIPHLLQEAQELWPKRVMETAQHQSDSRIVDSMP